MSDYLPFFGSELIQTLQEYIITLNRVPVDI